MIRKLFFVPLCAFALLLLMGASAAPQQSAALLAEEESAVLDEAELDTDSQASSEAIESVGMAQSGEASATESMSLEEKLLAEQQQAEEQQAAAQQAAEQQETVTGDQTLWIDGVAAPSNLGKFQKNGVTYVGLAAMAKALDSSVEVSWDGSTATLKTGRLTLSAKVGQLYLVANGRYLYLPEGVQIVNNMVTVPLGAVVEAFDATLSWDGATGVIRITRGSGGIQSGDSYYNQEDLFWLSRIIYAESGNQPLEGQMAVGNVVMNRVASPAYPNTVQGVLAQKNQFTTYKSGALANRTPNQSSVIAAKLVLDGGEVEETDGALYFDSSSNSWASRNREFAAVLGGHTFYY